MQQKKKKKETQPKTNIISPASLFGILAGGYFAS